MNRGAHFVEELIRLTEEATLVYEKIVIPGWLGPHHGMPDTLYGYMMGLFARIDLVSAHWRGSDKSQSERMTSFIASFIGVDRKIASLATQIWRHKLMHTASPRQWKDQTTGKVYGWLLHWGDDHLPRVQHFTLRNEILNLSLFGLLEDFGNAVDTYLAQLTTSSKLVANYDSAHAKLSNNVLARY